MDLRSPLFVPASKPELFPKALAAGADCVCADLEDAVPDDAKVVARQHGVTFLTGGPDRALRINSLRSRIGLEDVLALQDAAPTQGLFCLPKVESADEVRWAAEFLGRVEFAALIETPRALKEAFAIASASPRLKAILFGAADFSAQMNMPLEDEPLAYARGRLAHAARVGSVEPIDVPCVDFRNLAEVERQARPVKRLGFTGTAAIHPSSVAAINGVFVPTAEELEEAEAIVAAFRAAKGGVTSHRGRLVEEPIVRRMLRLIEARGRNG